MDVKELKRLLCRFKLCDFDFVQEKWGRNFGLDFSRLPEKRTKGDIQNLVEKKFKKREVEEHAIGSLDLLYVQKYPEKKLWSVYKLEIGKGGKLKTYKEAHKLQLDLHKHISSYYRNELVVRYHKGAMWVRVTLAQTIRPRGGIPTVVMSQPTYIVHTPGTPYLMFAGLKASCAKFIQQAVLSTLGGRESIQLPLSGKSLPSLFHLCLNKHAKDASKGGKYHIPVPALGKKRKHSDTDEILPSNVHNENVQDRKRRKSYVDTTFGEYEQPKLEKISYKLETRFRGTHYVPGLADRTEPFSCMVRFEGPSVLEGIRQLALAGLAKQPMKPHLRNVHNMARNSFVLAEKKPTNNIQSQSTSSS